MPRRLTVEERRWRSMTERQWQSWVIDLARAYGWKVWHFSDSRRQIRPGVFVGDRDAAGFPDLVLAHPRGGLLFRELKREGQNPTPVQVESMAILRAAGCDVAVWRPSDEAAVERRLSAVRGTVNA